MSLWLAGEAGQVSLARAAGLPGMRASVDQHAAVIRDALGGRLTVGTLLSYAQGFTEAVVAPGWWPRGFEEAVREPGLDWELGAERELGAGRKPGLGREPGPEWELGAEREAELDCESLRLAAVCRLVLEVRGLGV